MRSLISSEPHHSRRRFKLSQMELISRTSSETLVNGSVKETSPSHTTPRPKARQYRVESVRDPASYMTAGLKRHFDNAQFSDLIVRCRDDEYHVHRIILCSHSQWFAKVCAIAPSNTEHQTIDLSADDPDAIDAMLQYCYQLDYADKFLGLPSAGYTIYTLLPHIDIYLLAHRYKMPGLKSLALRKFETRATVLSRVNVNKDKFFQAIRVIYKTTRGGEGDGDGDELRKVAVGLCADHADMYILQGGKTAARVFKLMDEIPAFRMDFIRELAGRVK